MAKKKGGKLRVALIGAGGVSGAHLQSLCDMEDVDLVAVADIVEESAQRRAEEFGIPETFTDHKKMLRNVEPDAVSVCTPNGQHAPCAIAALNAGAHVMVEKPLAMNAREGKRMLEAATRNGRSLIIGFQYRFDPSVQFIKRAADEGQLGRIVFARVRSVRRRGIPNWGVFGRKDLQGGGPLIDIGVHALEATHYVMGSPRPVAATGSTYTYLGDKKSSTLSRWRNWDHESYTVEDLAVGQIRFENGATLHLESSFAAHIEKDEECYFTVMGEKGGASLDPLRLYTDVNDHMVSIQPDWLPKGNTFALKLRNFVDHVLHGEPTMAPGEHGLMVQKMLDGIYASAEKGREVKIA